MYGNNNYLFMVPAGKRLTALIIRLSSSLDQGLEDFVFSPAEVPLREKERLENLEEIKMVFCYQNCSDLL